MGIMGAHRALLVMTSMVCLLFAANAWILRSKCKAEAVFTIKVTNRALEGSVLTRNTVSSVQECFSACLHHPSCQSVNYKEEALDNCELNEHVKENLLEMYFKAITGWTYFATNYTENNIGMYCRDHKPCNANELCIDTCSCQQYTCVKKCQHTYTMDRYFKCEPENIGFAKPANLSSNYRGRSSALNAVDGSRNTSILSCAETNKEERAWIIVDLGKQATVWQIDVYVPPVGDRSMRAFDVRVGNEKSNGGIANLACKTEIETKLSAISIQCPYNTKGQYVTVNVHNESFLEVCEVEVYGHFLY